MQDLDDLALLREYAANNSEAAYAELVARRIGFVYSAALRQVRDPHLAGEITQAVFIILAQKAGKISDQGWLRRPRRSEDRRRGVAATNLIGWLFKTTRYVAIAQTREIVKRSLRTATIEKEFQMQTELQSAATDPLWEQMSPLLDEALAALGETDRQAVLLRFFENKSLAEVGNYLGIGEDTARKRVTRALEKLHRYFNKRGVSSTTAIIAGMISANSVHAAPVGLAKLTSTIAISKGATATTSTLALVKETMKLTKWSNMKIAIIAGAAMILAVGVTTLIAAHAESSNKSDDKLYYNMLDDAYQLAHSVDQSKFVLKIFIRPLNKPVRISDIHLTVQSLTEGVIPIELGTNGEVLNVPHDEKLRRENPPVEHQPTNRLNLTINCYIPLPENFTFHYKLFSDGAAEADKMLVRADKIIKASYADQVPANMRKMMEKIIKQGSRLVKRVNFEII